MIFLAPHATTKMPQILLEVISASTDLDRSLTRCGVSAKNTDFCMVQDGQLHGVIDVVSHGVKWHLYVNCGRIVEQVR